MKDLVDVGVAARFAARLAAPGPLDRSYLMDGLQESFSALVEEAEPLISGETGFHPATPAVARVLSRAEWATSNVESILTLLAPLLEKVDERIAERKAPPAVRVAYRTTLGAQLGAVLGFLSQRVLGQYDTLMSHQDEVWFVGPNIILTERRLGFTPRDFRLWVVLHELTHRSQFEANPWVRDYFLSAVNEMLSSMDLDARTLLERLQEASRKPNGESHFALRLLTPEQLQTFNRLQAFMSVIEGHGNFIMDRVGEGLIPSQARMRRELNKASASGGVLAKLIGKVLGLDLKRAQYQLGQKFFDTVFREGGQDAVRACFESPAALPTLEEVKDPKKWLQRVAT
ncbi:MAG: zinc-dependent metalloprotease [Actinomycetota bacterium]|nr:zinc-dependent metalloprotease [Actinomycetota bacterium]